MPRLNSLHNYYPLNLGCLACYCVRLPSKRVIFLQNYRYEGKGIRRCLNWRLHTDTPNRRSVEVSNRFVFYFYLTTPVK